MSAKDDQTSLDVDSAFFKSKRGIVKVAEMVTLFVAFVSFAAASSPKFLTATLLEFIITSLLLLFYLLKLNKKLTFLFWPLVDVFNSAFASVYLIVLSLLALTSNPPTGGVVGGVLGLLAAGLLLADCVTLCRNITFNTKRGQTTTGAQE